MLFLSRYNYAPKVFGGILQYADTAIKTFDAQKKKHEQRNLEAREAQLKARYERYREHEIHRIKSTLSSEELSAMEDAIRAELVAEGTFPAMVNLGMHVKLHADLADRAGIPPYEEWRSQQT